MKLSFGVVVLAWSTTSGQAFVTPHSPSNPAYMVLSSSSSSTRVSSHRRYHQSFASRAEEQEEVDFDEEQQQVDEEYYEPSKKSFQDFQEELQALAFMSSMDRNASRRAQQVFDEMFEAHITEDKVELWPNVTIYNLLIDAHAWSRHPNGASEAQYILERMQDARVEEIARPNVDTYIKVMEGWANRKQPLQAEQVFESLQKRYELTKSTDVKPNTGAYNKRIKAWLKSGLPIAGEKAEAILREMLELTKKGDTTVQPNRKTWVDVMKAHAETGDAESIDKIQNLLREMAKLYRLSDEDDNQPQSCCRPDTQCYNVLVKAVGQNPAVENGPMQALELLYEMMEAYEDGDEALRPNGATFVNVYNSFRNSAVLEAANHVEKLLQLQEQMQQDKKDDLKPDVRAYNAVLTVLAQCDDPNKAVRAKRILDRMKESTDKDVAPNLRTYNNVLNACAYTQGEPKELLEAFRVAVQIINDLRESTTITADPVSYGLFLKSCAQLMAPSEKREVVVENIFRKCASEGQVGSYVLYELSNAASPQLSQRLLGGDMEDGVSIPSEWSRNVQNKRQRLR